METTHYDIEKSKEIARKLLHECGLSRWQVMQIPRKKPLTTSEINRIMVGRQYARLKDEHGTGSS